MAAGRDVQVTERLVDASKAKIGVRQDETALGRTARLIETRAALLEDLRHAPDLDDPLPAAAALLDRRYTEPGGDA